MKSTLRQQLIKQRAVARGMLSRIQNFIEAGDQKLNDIQVSSNKLPDIFNRYMTLLKVRLELSDDIDHSGNRELFENQYNQVEAKLIELLRPVVELPQSRHSSLRSSSSERRNNSPRSNGSSVDIKLPVISLPTHDGETCSWPQYRDTFKALIVNNTTLSNVQKFHYFIASLNNEAKDLISKLKITNDNFLVAWQLVTQRYNNKRHVTFHHIQLLRKKAPHQIRLHLIEVLHVSVTLNNNNKSYLWTDSSIVLT
jgi:hypothetical protein